MKTVAMHPGVAAEHLRDKYGFEIEKAKRAILIARRYGMNAEPIATGVLRIHHVVASDRYRIEESTVRTVATPSAVRYDRSPRPKSLSRKVSNMARGRTVAEPEPDEEAKDYTVYAGKEPTVTMVDFADWLIEEVGLEFANQKLEDAFRDGVRLGGTLRMEFQKSEFNQERREERRTEREKAAAAEAKTKTRSKAATKTAEEDEDEEDEDEAPAPKTTRTRTTAKAPAGKAGTAAKAPPRRRGAAAKAEAAY